MSDPLVLEAVFYKGKEDLFGRAIRWWTRSPFSHCELHFGDGRCFSAFPGVGVGWFNRDLKLDDWVRVPVFGQPLAMFPNKLLQFCHAETGCPYDWRGIWFSQVFPWGWQSKTRWFCSELCTAALQHIGQLRHLRAWEVSPERLYQELT